MSRGTDDDALAWGGDDDPTLDAGTTPVREARTADERTPEPPRPHEATDAAATDAATESVGTDAPPDAASIDPSTPDDSADAAPDDSADAAPRALPDGFTAVGKGSAEVGRINADGSVTMPGERAPMGNAVLISLGILGGVYLLYAIGWIIGGLRLQGARQYLVSDVMYQGSLWLAVLAPLLWFATVFLLTMRSRPWVRFAWLIAGVALLLPWPFVMIGAVGQ